MNLDAEDQKLLTLAKGARGRINAAAGACVRDQDGRTYSGASVEIAGNTYGALELAVVTAKASGAKSLEAGCVVGAPPAEKDVNVFRVLAQSDAKVFFVNETGEVIYT